MALGRPDYYKSNVILGRYNGDFIPILLDSNGVLLTRLQAIYGSTLKDVLIDSTGMLYARIQGKYDSTFKDIAVNTDGKVITNVQGLDGSTLRSIFVDSAGKIVNRNQAVAGGYNASLLIDDGGDTDDISDWAEWYDALEPANIEGWGREGTKAMKLGIDADKNANDFGYWIKQHAYGDLSQHQLKHLHIRIYLETLDYFYVETACIYFSLGNYGSSDLAFLFPKADLKVGWNTLKCDLTDTDNLTGTVDWTDIDFLYLALETINDNTNDFFVIIDYIAIVEVNEIGGELIDLKADKDGALLTKLIGDYSGIQKPIAADIDGNLHTSIIAQTANTLISNNYKENLNHFYALRDHPGIESRVLCNIALPGIVMGGTIVHIATASHKTCAVFVTIDGNGFTPMTFESMNAYDLTHIWETIPHLTHYDDTAFLYKVSLPAPIIFKTSFIVTIYEQVGATADTKLFINYGYF